MTMDALLSHGQTKNGIRRWQIASRGIKKRCTHINEGGNDLPSWKQWCAI